MTAPPVTVQAALLGPSAAITRVREQLQRVGPHFRAALLTGERGCGAEAAARMLHAFSPLATAPLHILPQAEAETALSRAPDAAATLLGLCYLPQLERLTLTSQRALLRLLRLAGPGRLRVVGFSSSDLRALVATGNFSAELADLLQAVRVPLPTLRERRDDLPLLATHLVQRLALRQGRPAPILDAELLIALQAQDWPGNLRQLQRVLGSLLADPSRDKFHAADLERAVAENAVAAETATAREKLLKLDHVIQHHVRTVLLSCGGNKLRAAEVLGISRSTLYRMLESGLSEFSVAS
jgi:DNA-binding NtrC family response regulator